MKLIPTGDNIFVKVEEEKQGIVNVPPVFRRRNQIALKGTVIMSGPRSLIKKGERVVFSKTEDHKIMVNGKELMLIKPYAILAVQ